MKTRFAFLGLLVFSFAAAQQQHPTPKAVIYGVAITSDGGPAKRLGLAAMPLGVPLSTALPHTKTNDRGEYRFANLPWWGRYAVYANDEKAGYSSYSTGTAGNSQFPEVEVTPERPKAEYNLSLPPKAGFIQIHLTNLRTGIAIPTMTIRVVPMDRPDAHLFTDPLVFTMSCYSDHVILVPPSENLLLHVTSDGFREWDESVGKGKPINVPSGGVLTLNVQLEPVE